MTNRRRVVVTGLGAVTPLGDTLRSTWSGILEGRGGAAPITLFDTKDLAVRFACEVKHWEPTKRIDPRRVRELDRFSQFALAAAEEAVSDSGLVLSPKEETRAGCILGVGMGGLSTIENTIHAVAERANAKVSPYVIPAVTPNLAAGQISIRHRLRGPSFSIASACATGGHAVGEAAEWIRRGRADVMITGGAEAAITPFAMRSFHAMRALSRRNDKPESASRPFDRARDGFVVGEGSGVLVLESLERALARNARIYAELTGYGASSDASHVVLPAADGEGAKRSMEMALEDAELEPTDIDHVNAHATSTPTGDVAEANAITALFRNHVRSGALAVSATKSMTGHMLGAAGAVEAIFTALSVHGGIIPPSVNVDEIDPGVMFDIARREPVRRPVRHAMSNAFGFGGTNATLLFSRLDSSAR